MRRKVISSVLAGVGLLLVSSTAQAAVEVGDTPSFEVKALDGSKLSLEQYRGKIIIVDFWATWCGPCMAEAEHMVKINTEFGPQGVQFVGVSLDDDERALRSVIKDKKFDWPQFYDGAGWGNRLAKEWGVKSIPATFILDPEGKVVWKGHPARIDEALAKAMRDTPPSAIDPALARATQATLDEIEKLMNSSPAKALDLLGGIDEKARKVDDLNQRITKAETALTKFGQSVVAEAEKLIGEKKYADAGAKLTSVVSALANTEAGKLAKQKLEMLDALPEYIAQKEAAAKADAETAAAKKKVDDAAALLKASTDALASAKALQEKKRHEDAYAAYKLVVRKFPDTDAAKTAADAIAAYDKDVAFIRAMNDKAARERAEGMLSLARNYANAGNVDTARRKYKEIMNTFPNTTYFDKAKKELAELEAKAKKK